jgi:precorrin-6B methylase 2
MPGGFGVQRTMLRFIAALLLTTTLVFAGEIIRPPDPLYEKRVEHDRNGIGKFFLGREIAHVMGHQAAGWLERPEREQEERTDLLLDALDLKPGENVADIGCGTGYFAERMARKIGPDGVVYGVDIQQEMLDLMQRKMRLKQIKNVKSVLGTEADPKLAPESCDLMIMIDVYHEFEFPYEMIRKMIAGLKKGGRIVFVEYRAEDPNVPIKAVHKMSEAQVKKEMAIHPEMEFVQTRRELPQQHIIIFKKKG